MDINSEKGSLDDLMGEFNSALVVFESAKKEFLKPTTTAFLHMVRGLKENAPTIYAAMIDESTTKAEGETKLNLNDLLKLSLEPNRVFDVLGKKLDEVAQDKLCGDSLFDQQELKDFYENQQPSLFGIANCDELEKL